MIPIIKFSALQAGTGEVDKLHDACLNWGLFYLEDTPVSPAARASVFERSKQFFDLPSDQKRILDIKHSENFRGYVGPGEETTNGRPDLKESLEFAQESLTLPDTPKAPFSSYLASTSGLMNHGCRALKRISLRTSNKWRPSDTN